VKHGGSTDASNLALACFDCNRFKGSDIASIDPDDGRLASLFNPRTEVWTEHFRAAAGEVMPLTSVGRVTVALLQMNLSLRVEVRDELMRLGRWPRFRE
jgi:HNH endonuclease